MDYRQQNRQLLSVCLNFLNDWQIDKKMKLCLRIALEKAIKQNSKRPVPPLLSQLLAEDLGYQSAPWTSQLSMACAYFYTAADLLDDIQDQDPHQPVLQIVSAAQAMNITNLLLMGVYQVLAEIDLPVKNRLALVQKFTQMGTIMSQGQYWDIATTNQAVVEHAPEKIARAKAGAEFACFLATVPCALGLEPEPFYQLGEEMGLLLQVFTDYFDVWIVPDQQAISQDLLVLKNSYPLYTAREQSGYTVENEISLALAGKNHLPQKQFQLRRYLAQTPAIPAFEQFLQKMQNALDDSFAQLPALPQLQALCRSDLEQAQELSAGLNKLQQITCQDRWRPHYAVQQSVEMALDYLTFIPDFRDVWEVQRWGFLETPILYGDLFNPLLVLEALASCGQDIQHHLPQFIQKSAEDGWHYYSNTQKIPTDTDDLGQILHLAALLPVADFTQWLEKPLEILLKNLESSGKCPTWLCDESNFKREDVEKAWYGNECPAVMANLYYGLACYDAKRFAAQLERGLAYLLKQYAQELPGWQGVYYASSTYTTYLVTRLIKKQQASFQFEPLIEHFLLHQLLDGSWNQSPQETAFAILFLLEAASQPKTMLDNLKRAQAFLVDSQNFDGSWPGEELFIRPGKAAVFENFAHPKLTSAYCVRALKKSQAIFD